MFGLVSDCVGLLVGCSSRWVTHFCVRESRISHLMGGIHVGHLHVQVVTHHVVHIRCFSMESEQNVQARKELPGVLKELLGTATSALFKCVLGVTY